MRIGFMGGTFSPPHKGHLHSAKVFIEEMLLDELIIIPAKVSPFKVAAEKTATDCDRFEMAKLCFLPLDSGKCRVWVSDLELSKGGTSYTIETIETLKKLYPDDELYMFIGSDMFLSLENWKSFSDIFKNCRIYTRCREENEMQLLLSVLEKYEKLYGAKVTLSKDKEVVVSSTMVRNALALQNTEICRNLLTDEVLGYIIKGGLYFDR